MRKRVENMDFLLFRQAPDANLCADLKRMATLRPTVFREPELLEAACELLTRPGEKTAVSSYDRQEQPRVAQATACSILTSALKVVTARKFHACFVL